MSGCGVRPHPEGKLIPVGIDDIEITHAACVQAVLSTEEDESAGGYFVTGTMNDLLPTW